MYVSDQIDMYMYMNMCIHVLWINFMCTPLSVSLAMGRAWLSLSQAYSPDLDWLAKCWEVFQLD